MKHVIPAVLLLMCLVLGYRLVVLEGEIAALEQRIAPAGATDALAGGPQPAAPSDSAARADVTPAPQAPRAAAADPLNELEAELAALRADIRSLEEATGDTASVDELETAVAEERILGVVKREQERLRDKHLSYQHDRWMQWRQDALDAFAEQHAIDEGMKQDMLELLEHEADGLVALAKQPWFAEDPRRTVQAWRAQLQITDTKVGAMLEGDALQAWRRDRLIERALLWPWLLDGTDAKPPPQ